jgi:hypothetical protein
MPVRISKKASDFAAAVIGRRQKLRASLTQDLI